MFRSCQIIIRELCSLLKLYYGIHNSIRIWVSYYSSYDAHLATATATTHSHTTWYAPQHLVCKYELNCEYCSITLARNKAPWWWSDKIETCRSVLKCFMWNYMCIRWLINWSEDIMVFVFFPWSNKPQCVEASRSHSDTPHSIGLLWTSDQPDAETHTFQHSEETDIHVTGGIRTRNPRKGTANETGT